ncbi:hypothetical protein M9H77_27792 [Catharanthus roseus]|uniref:Uncharacterized protein n=1 Tax=Catharanthus roseus TaxID=4058 RepID=A0ACC0AED9_CATRO|nr:hypothetical protein M9H77_27792 [Catharanthus roseus]
MLLNNYLQQQQLHSSNTSLAAALPRSTLNPKIYSYTNMLLPNCLQQQQSNSFNTSSATALPQSIPVMLPSSTGKERRKVPKGRLERLPLGSHHKGSQKPRSGVALSPTSPIATDPNQSKDIVERSKPYYCHIPTPSEAS